MAVVIVVVNEEFLGVRRSSALVGFTHARVYTQKKQVRLNRMGTQPKCNNVMFMAIVTSSLPWTDRLKLQLLPKLPKLDWESVEISPQGPTATNTQLLQVVFGYEQ